METPTFDSLEIGLDSMLASVLGERDPALEGERSLGHQISMTLLNIPM